MTVDQREKIQRAISALIDVETALLHTDSAAERSPELLAVQVKLHAARTALIELNAPDYN